LENVMESFPGSVFWKDRNLVYLGCNLAEARSAGLASPRDIVGKTDFDLGWSEGEAEFFRASDMRVLESGAPVLNIAEAHMYGGEPSWMETSKAPIFDSAGRISGILGVSLDITERRRAEMALRESEASLERAEMVAKIGNWKLMLDTGEIVGSAGACSIYGVQRDRMSLREIQAMVLPEYRSEGDRALAELIERDAPYRLKAKIRRPSDGRVLDILSTATYDRRQRVVHGVVQDVTDHKAAL
ncbi:MAG TPA: PAS domain-containing protein, partial [Rectinemataceae bacterium]|nr:PAS domain-containing protein [Rectinemataceae bacterium]